MNRLVYFLLSLPILLAFSTSADAGPACARRNQGADACIQRCRDKWGWPGHVMGTDRWGQVITKTVTDDMGAIVTQACRVRPSGLGSAKAATTTIASSTSPLLVPPPSSSVPANAIISASVSSVISAAPSVSLLPLTHSTSKKASFSAFVASTTAPSSSSVKPSTTLAPPSSSTTSSTTTHTTTSHTEAAPPPNTTTTKKTSSQQPAATQESSSGQSQSSGNNNNGDSGSSGSTNNNGNSGSGGSSSNSGATSQSDIDQYLQAHNSVRAQHGAAPLSWSDDLAAKAQQWANNCVFQHSGGKLGPFGENLAAGTGDSYGIQSAVKSWTDEVSEYDPNNPQPSHFTQVVWKASTQVGCAVQSCNGIFDAKFGPAKFFVCEYSPQGNVIGHFGQNVQA